MLTWSELFPAAPSVLTIVGMAKNAGKTVALNTVQRMLQEAGHVLALTSIGRDGESFDALTRFAKPAVTVREGTLVATAGDVIAVWPEWEKLRETSLETPLGRVVILRARRQTQVVLAGPSKNSEVQALLKDLKDLGAGPVLIDGAFDRQSSADPVVSHQVILATGATLSRNLEELIALTQSRVDQLTLPECSPGLLERVRDCAARVALVREQDVQETALATALVPVEEWRHLLGGSCQAVIVRGAVGEGLGLALLEQTRPPEVVVDNGSRIFLDAALWRRLHHRGVRFSVRRGISLLGVTVNPTYPGRAGYDPDGLLSAMGAALAPLPVLDMMREKRYAP